MTPRKVLPLLIALCLFGLVGCISPKTKRFKQIEAHINNTPPGCLPPSLQGLSESQLMMLEKRWRKHKNLPPFWLTLLINAGYGKLVTDDQEGELSILTDMGKIPVTDEIAIRLSVNVRVVRFLKPPNDVDLLSRFVTYYEDFYSDSIYRPTPRQKELFRTTFSKYLTDTVTQEEVDYLRKIGCIPFQPQGLTEMEVMQNLSPSLKNAILEMKNSKKSPNGKMYDPEKTSDSRYHL